MQFILESDVCLLLYVNAVPALVELIYNKKSLIIHP
jgi:hypothetical protein